MKKNTIGFIGAGNMASAMISGLVSKDIEAKQVRVFDPNIATLDKLSQQFGIIASANNDDLVAECDIIILAIKPQVMQAVLTPLQAAFHQKKASQPLIISIAAGIPCSHINKWLSEPQAIVRVMPNTPALIIAGASGLYANEHVSNDQRQAAEMLIKATGSVEWLNVEADIDAVTALSGSGPAYFMLFIQSLIASGVKAGLSPDTAEALAVQTCEGTAKLIRSSDTSIEQLIKNVTSPGGTTEQALKSFTDNELPMIVAAAFDAALKRSQELANELQ